MNSHRHIMVSKDYQREGKKDEQHPGEKGMSEVKAMR